DGLVIPQFGIVDRGGAAGAVEDAAPVRVGDAEGDGHVVQRQVAAQVADGAALGARPAREARAEGQVGYRGRHPGGNVNDAEREVSADRQGVLAEAGEGKRAGDGGQVGGEGDGLAGEGGVKVDRVRPGRGVGREDGGAEGDGAGRGGG